MHGCQDVGKTIQISRILLSRFLKQSLAHCSWYDYLVTESIEPPLMSVGGGGGRGRVRGVTCSQLTPVKWVHYCYWGVIISLLRNFYHPSYSYSQASTNEKCGQILNANFSVFFLVGLFCPHVSVFYCNARYMIENT